MELTTSKQSKQLSEVSENRLTRALKTCSKGNVAELVKYSVELTKTDIDIELASKTELKEDLERLRSEWKWLKSQDETKGDKEQMLQEIEQKAQTIKDQLAEIPNYLSIAEMDKEEPDRLRARVLVMVNNLANFLNIGKNIHEMQLQEIVETLCQEAKGLVLEDLLKMLHLAKTGYYGDIYDRLDGALILSWLRKYKEERRQRIMARNQSQKAAYQSTRHRDKDKHHALGKPLHMKSLMGLSNYARSKLKD